MSGDFNLALNKTSEESSPQKNSGITQSHPLHFSVHSLQYIRNFHFKTVIS